MVPDPDKTSVGMEYFCQEGDEIWMMHDADLADLAARELHELGLVQENDILDSFVIRQPKAYPVYDEGYAENVAVVRSELESKFPTLFLAGRNGMHKYNNQDHAIMTAMLTVDNILAGAPLYNPWHVNEDAEYRESGSAGSDGASGLRLVPQRVEAPATAGTR